MKPAGFAYTRAASAAEAATLLAAAPGEGRLLAGGQSLGPAMNLRLARPAYLIDIGRLNDLRTLASDGDMLSIGAGWTHAEIEDGVVTDPANGLLRHVAGGIAHRAVRNRGTIGGSLAHADPAADWVSTMAALGATLVARQPAGALVRYPAETFLRGAFATLLAEDEVLIAVELRRLSPGARWGFHKICRKAGAFATAIGIAVSDPARNLRRVVAGAVDGPPLVLNSPDPTTLDAAIDAGLPHLDPRRRAQHAIAVRRALAML